MPAFWQDFLVLFKRHPKFAAILGFLSIYIFWAIPAVSPFINWSEWSSYAYLYGDHLVLPLFNALAFWLLSKNKARISKKAVLIPLATAIILTILFEPDASSFLRAGSVDSFSRAYHSGFISLEFGFIVFMFGVYPHVRDVYAPLWIVAILVGLIEAFLGFVHIADAWMHNFTLVENISPAALLIVSYIILVLRRINLKRISKTKTVE